MKISKGHGTVVYHAGSSYMEKEKQQERRFISCIGQTELTGKDRSLYAYTYCPCVYCIAFINYIESQTSNHAQCYDDDGKGEKI